MALSKPSTALNVAAYVSKLSLCLLCYVHIMLCVLLICTVSHDRCYMFLHCPLQHSHCIVIKHIITVIIISERELMFMFAICRRPSVCLSVCRLSVVCLSSVTFVHPTQPIDIFGNISAPCNTLVT